MKVYNRSNYLAVLSFEAKDKLINNEHIYSDDMKELEAKVFQHATEYARMNKNMQVDVDYYSLKEEWVKTKSEVHAIMSMDD